MATSRASKELFAADVATLPHGKESRSGEQIWRPVQLYGGAAPPRKGRGLLGYARQAELSNVHVVNQRRYGYAFFVQDDWRASDRRFEWRCCGHLLTVGRRCVGGVYRTSRGRHTRRMSV